MKSVEVYILSGFLGAGKTTLLQNILTQEKQLERKIAVIMNELGEVSIDSNAIPEETPLKELLNGCVCCTIQGQLEVQLENMLREFELDAIYIETTGVAHPIEVLDACMSPLFAEKLSIQGIITIIDANRWKDRSHLSIQLRKLLIEQVQHADIVLLNKIDQLKEAEQANIVSEVQSLNTNGKLLMTEFANVPLSQLRNYHVTSKSPHQKTHVHQHLHMRSFVHTFSKPIDLDAFEQFLKEMPDTIYRIKGYIRFTHSDKPFLFQYSYGMPLYMKEQMNRKNTLVFIGENLNHQVLETTLLQLERHSNDS
ncbi:CobW family GTP-binding protein [Metabacillus malikii]|uniref:G3E family GTPase n=1 Tax=Metabacillus malikii TaxID=1504265 RepID=A0ABT9ZH93_9BACI|nr:GTP-binding protein [Metabacillus malikii]MDQ0231345.1 G3E family GTPase [Metabacillus malikii]